MESNVNEINERAKNKEVVKYTVKDSVFTNLFSDKKYLMKFYNLTHPEDKDITEDELKDITIHNILTDDIYNDVGFTVGGRFLMLLECQATWTVNIIIRCLIYLMATYQDYFAKTKQNVYKSKKVHFPKPELYVVFVGERKTKPEYISLSEEFFNGEECFIDAKVKVLYGTNEDDVISQYVMFTKIYNEQVKLHGRTRKAIKETIRICKDQDILKEYFESKEEEVVSIMLALYDEQQILEQYIEGEKKEAAEEAAKEAAKEAATEMLKDNVPIEKILKYHPSLSIDDIDEIQDKLMFQGLLKKDE